jgi:hypothetical protein
MKVKKKNKNELYLHPEAYMFSFSPSRQSFPESILFQAGN